MSKIFIINGPPRAGKDTFVDFCKEEIGNCFVLNISTVTLVKQLAKMAGWNGEKTPENRRFLSDLKDLLTRWNDVPYNDMCKEIRGFNNELEQYGCLDKGIIFIHCREPFEINKFKERLGAKTILIDRNTNERILNHADEDVYKFQYDYIIKNNNDLANLKLQAKIFLKKIEAEN